MDTPGEPPETEWIAATESIPKWHLVPYSGAKKPRRDHQRAGAEAQTRAGHDRAPRTVNNVLTVLSTMLKKAVEWGELEHMPCTVRLLANPKRRWGSTTSMEDDACWPRPQGGVLRRT